MADAGKLITDVEALKQQRVPAARASRYPATEHPSTLTGSCCAFLENRLPVLIGDGGSTLEQQARAALQPIERLQHDPESTLPLAQAMPSCFRPCQRRQESRAGLMCSGAAHDPTGPCAHPVLEGTTANGCRAMGLDSFLGSFVVRNTFQRGTPGGYPLSFLFPDV